MALGVSYFQGKIVYQSVYQPIHSGYASIGITQTKTKARATFYFSMTPTYYYKALSHAYHLIFIAILAGRNDYSSFPKEGTEAARSCDLSKATELVHGRLPLSSTPQLLHDNISSCRKCFSLSIYSSFLSKIIPWVMITPSAWIKWRNGRLLPSYSLQYRQMNHYNAKE